TSFSQGGVTVKVAWESAAIGSRGIRGTRRPGGKRLPRGSPGGLPAGAAAGLAGGVAGVAAAGDEEEVGLGAPAVGVADVEVFGEVAEEADAGVGSPVEGLQGVV